MAKRKPIRLKVAAPCEASWAQMKGDDAQRHCGQCDKSVYNLSHMTSEQIEELLATNQADGVCGRFYQRKDGTVLTADCPTGLRKRRRKQVIAGVGAGLMAAFGVAGAAATADKDSECDAPRYDHALQGAVAPMPAPEPNQPEVTEDIEPDVQPVHEPEVVDRPMLMGRIAPANPGTKTHHNEREKVIGPTSF